ncbi:J domain-containing protein required for chloroplast accumulation response 1 [Rutidosis leptorrhynchoides]|uniref:J domain-containing protein required for chloroplast accumulation response 1 n=1 Tax=Rutidosis leptorrhynchoides TaxID=125765 RepID=UPI003A99102F
MERVAQTANLSIRYGRSFENEASSSSMRNSDDDVDFDDVFGGPPTRTRYSFGGSRIKSSEESTSSPAGLSEKPVFGESYCSPRRQTSDDFYNDIFRRSDESVRSPRWRSPSSRTLNPANIEPFGTSLPAEFSLPAKMTKAVDIPVFGSNVHTPNASLTRFSSGQTLLSRESSSVKESSYTTRYKEDEVDQKSSGLTRTGSPSSEFHFSIHKWANVGVPLLMSLRGGMHPTMKGSSKVSAVSTDNMPDSVFTNDDLSIKKDDINLSKVGVMEVNEKETVQLKLDVKEPEVIPAAASSLLHDEIERQGYEDAGKEVEEKENVDKKKKKVEAKKTSFSKKGKKAEANDKPGVLSPKSSPKSRVKGMVKEFFKKSNQESPPKTKTSVSSRWKTNTRNRTQEEVDDIISKLDTSVPDNVEVKPDELKSTKVDSELPAENVKIAPDDSSLKPLDTKLFVDNVEKIPDASFMVKEQVERLNKQNIAKNRTIRKLEDINFQKDTSTASVLVVHEQIEELAPMEDKLSKTQEESEAIMALDSKIHTWSSGRKGNIRSLLSTLQLVLWAESGWKPVALVDIIESNAVKKAYNRAMLCLHPDKLQQKGADAHKKYMAEKVFDILQVLLCTL